MAPASMRSLAARAAGFHVIGQLTKSRDFAAFAVRTIASAWERLMAMGFSTQTAVPAFAHSSTTSGWRKFSEQQIARSSFSDFSISR